MIVIHFDGLCEPSNPGGHGCCGFTIQEDGATLYEGGVYLGRSPDMTNSVAEYSALIHALEKARDLGLFKKPCAELVCRGDSKLVVEQVNGNWKINKPHLQRAVDRVMDYFDGFGIDWTLEWVPREQNHSADQLSRKAYHKTTGKEPPIRGNR